MALDVSGFSTPADKYEGLYQIANTLERRGERKYEMDYRHQKDVEAEQWKKLNLIQDLTDLSKHQTGSDVANAVGNKLMSDVYQKYTANADKMSPIELQANIQKDMSGIITGMEGTKNELAQADKAMAAIKQAYPGIDTATLYDHLRKDVVHRRLRDDMSGFKNEMEVPPTQFDLSNPEILSHYVVGDKNLKTYFTNPQGLDQTDVFTGNRNNYTKFSAKIPAWKKPNFKPEDVEGGFLKKGQPGLSFKSSTLPTDAMPNSKNAPFEMIDEDVFNQLGGNEKLELIAATRNQIPGYDKMNPTEKEYAQRHIYLKTAKSLDQLDFHPTDIHTPSASMLKFYAGGSGANNKPIELRDIYKEVNDLAKGNPEGTVNLPDLTPEAQGVILKFANELRGLGGDLKMSQDEVFIKKQPNGDLNIIDKKTEKPITKIPYESLNLPVNPGLKAKQEVLKKAKEQSAPTQSKMVTVILSDGRKGQIPEDKVSDFLKDNMGSKRQ